MTSQELLPGDSRSLSTRTLTIAMVGTRGVPAQYGGFETAVEEVGRRLVDRGHRVVVYCRQAQPGHPTHHLGMDLVHLPAARHKVLETLSHTGLSSLHALTHRAPDVALVFNAANAPFLPLLRARGIPVATHVDGLEWQRAKWGRGGRAYYRVAESLAVRWSDALIADARGIEDYYLAEFGAPTEAISYGAPLLSDLACDGVRELGLEPGRYHLVVARFEPENHVHLAVEGYAQSCARLPLVVVGSAPYADRYTGSITEAAAADPRIRLLGPVWDQDRLDQLYAHAFSYVHGHSVGGTNPSLLRAMGAGTAVLAYDVVFNREVLGADGRFFGEARGLAAQVEAAERDHAGTLATGRRLQERAATVYRWDDVADCYEDLCRRLADAPTRSPALTGRRLPPAPAQRQP